MAETAFIGGKNLIVEGTADQVLLAGMSNALRSRMPTARLLDLNEVTIVPAGSADSVPYIAYLARGRDPIKPPCVALLDGDDDGKRAIGKLKKSEANRKPVLDQKFVIRLDTWAESTHQRPSRDLGVDSPPRRALVSSAKSGVVTEIEDLIPPAVAVRAARSYANRLLGLDSAETEKLKESDLKSRIAAADKPLWDVLHDLFAKTFGEGIDKVGFAREVVSYVTALPHTRSRPTGVPDLEANFAALLEHLAELLDEAATEEANRRRARRMGRIVRGFLDDYQTGASRSLADSRLREIESSLDDSVAHDTIKLGIARLRRDFCLRTDPTKLVHDFPAFRQQLEDLTHLERLASQEAAEEAGPEY